MSRFLSHLFQSIPISLFNRRVPEILQFEVNECGTCCLAMVLSYFGNWIALDHIRGLCGANRDGISAGSLVRGAKQLNMSVKGFGPEVHELVELPMPQILFWNFNHFIVLEKIQGDDIDIVDPAVGRRRLRFHELEEGYCGVTLCLAPDENFKITGSSPSVIREVTKAAIGSGPAIAAITIVSFGIAILMALVPSLTSIFIDYVLVKKGIDIWRNWFLWGVVGFGLILGPVSWMQKVGTLKLQTRLALTLATRIITKLFQVPLDYYARRFSTEIGGRVLLSDSVANTVSGSLVTMIYSLIQIVVFALVMLSYSVQLTVIIFLILLCYAVLVSWIVSHTSTLSRRLSMERGRYEAQLSNALRLLEHSRASGSSNVMSIRILERYIAVVNAEQENAPYSSMLGILPRMITGLVLACVTGLSAFEVINGRFSIGVFVAYNSMANILLLPFNQIVSGFSQISNSSGNFERVNDLLQMTSEEKIVSNKGIPDLWDVECKELNFYYGEQAILQNVSFFIKQGNFLGIAGSVGSGKSTLLGILAKIIEPKSGEILVGGISIDQIDRKNFSHSITMVPQKTQIFEGSILDNITLWDPEITEEQVYTACQLCSIHDEIINLPKGYKSILQEDGSDLSGGQKQRIALARAVVRSPKLLILDEATSALDARTEAKILKNLRESSMTLLFATHRLSNLRFSDKILFMQAGSILETGTHQQLIDLGGSYASLVASASEVHL